MARNAPTPVRFTPEVAARLAAWTATHAGLSLSSAANLLVDEGLRTGEHPGIVFRPGATGRRAGLAGGPDVWEVIRSVESARAATPGLPESELLALVSRNTGVAPAMVQIALHYWAVYPDEIDRQIRANETADEQAEMSFRRQQELLRRR